MNTDCVICGSCSMVKYSAARGRAAGRRDPPVGLSRSADAGREGAGRGARRRHRSQSDQKPSRSFSSKAASSACAAASRHLGPPGRARARARVGQAGGAGTGFPGEGACRQRPGGSADAIAGGWQDPHPPRSRRGSPRCSAGISHARAPRAWRRIRGSAGSPAAPTRISTSILDRRAAAVA